MNGFIDLHCHILPGLDDGPTSVDQSLEMLDIAAADGIAHIFATPHVMAGTYDNDTDRINEGLDRMRAQLPNGTRMFTGADVRITPDLPALVSSGLIPTLGNSGYLLIELPSYSMPLNLEQLVFNLLQKKVIPIITHPERHPFFAERRSLLKSLRSDGALCQVTAMSVTGGFGRQVQEIALDMIDEGLIDFVATDAHNAKRRPPILSKAYREVVRQFDTPTANRLFFTNPQMVLDKCQISDV
jgi:protein-tyrosine phosphatase